MLVDYEAAVTVDRASLVRRLGAIVLLAGAGRLGLAARLTLLEVPYSLFGRRPRTAGVRTVRLLWAAPAARLGGMIVGGRGAVGLGRFAGRISLARLARQLRR